MTNKGLRPLLLTVSEAARMLKLGRPKMYLFIQLGLVQAIRVGHQWRIRTSSVDPLIPAMSIPESETPTAVVGGNETEPSHVDLSLVKPTIERSAYVKRE